MADDSFFVVIEGMDGAGKTVNAKLLRDVLKQTHGDDVLLTNEPEATSLVGGEIREALARKTQFSPTALALAFALNRTDHLERIIEPFLMGEQRIVVCDRYLLSSLVYQSVDCINMEDVYCMNQWSRQPDLTIHLNIRPYDAYARLRKREGKRDLFEKNLAERAEKYQAAIALLRSKGETIIEIDANRSIELVFSDVLVALREHGPEWLRIQPPLLLE